MFVTETLKLLLIGASSRKKRTMISRNLGFELEEGLRSFLMKFGKTSCKTKYHHSQRDFDSNSNAPFNKT